MKIRGRPGRFYKGHRLVDTRLMEGSQLDASRPSVQRKLNKALKKMIIFEEVAQK